MTLLTLAFLTGDILIQLLPTQPSAALIYTLTFLSLLTIPLQKKFLTLIFVLTLGMSWTIHQISQAFSYTLPKQQEGKSQQLTGHIASLPTTDQWQTKFLFSPLSNPTIYLNLSTPNQLPDKIKVGDIWQFQSRLRRIHSPQNPGTFDYEAWAIQKKLRATGSIQEAKKLSHDPFYHPIDQLRQNLQERLQTNLPADPAARWLPALIIGERTNIPQEDWQVLRNTGTNHLMAIAGLHIGLLAGLAAWLASWLWRRIPRLCLILPAQQAAAYIALIIAYLYSALAGFSLPTQRACLMLTIFIGAILFKRKINPWNAWSIAMLIVLILNPLSVLTQSFWLSFATIALLIYTCAARLDSSSFISKHTKPQFVIALGLTPLSLLFFQECSLISFAANTIAIPWLGFFILPFCFFSSIFLYLSPPIAKALLFLASKSLTGLWIVLSWFANLPIASWHQAIPNQTLLALTIGGIILLLLPRGAPGRVLGVLWLMPLLLFKPATPPEGEFWLSLLDVGQGLSAVIQTHSHTLVFDAGPKFNANYDMGENVVLPYLHHTGIQKIDMLVVSHADNDHIGGTQALIKSLPIKSIKTSAPSKIKNHDADYCFSHDAWKWDKVTFSFLYPEPDTINLNNDSSCVLRVDNGKQSVLLTGDIEKFAEKELISKQAAMLKTNVLIAPHHGSKTSGLKRFVELVQPDYVLYAVGYRNRYRFPHQSVKETYAEIGTRQLDTVSGGEIEFRLGHQQELAQPRLYRMKKHYWYEEVSP